MPIGSQNLVIRRVKKVKKGGHHGGSWKIALADFALAMMAFFLVLWVMQVSTPQQLKSIQGYFNDPLGVANAGFSANPIDLGGSPAMSTEEKLDLQLPDPGSADNQVKERLMGSDAQSLQAMSGMIEEQMKSINLLVSKQNNLRIDLTPQGVRITLVDSPDQPMFASGSAEMLPDIVNILLTMSPIIAQTGNPIAIAGHTDASRFSHPERLDNWDLSALRANATRRILEEGGVPRNKVAQVVGLADSVPYNPIDLTAAENRRVSITLLTDEAYQAMLAQNIRHFGPTDEELQQTKALELTPDTVF